MMRSCKCCTRVQDAQFGLKHKYYQMDTINIDYELTYSIRLSPFYAKRDVKRDAEPSTSCENKGTIMVVW